MLKAEGEKYDFGVLHNYYLQQENAINPDTTDGIQDFYYLRNTLLQADSLSEEQALKVINNIAYLNRVDSFEMAHTLLNVSIFLSGTNSSYRAYFLFLKGNLLRAQNNDVAALECFLKSALIHGENNDEKGLAYTNYDIAFLNYRSNNYELALNYGQKGLQYFKPQYLLTRGDSLRYSSFHNIIGISYRRLSEYDSALVYIDKAIQMNLILGDSLRAIITKGNKAVVFYEQGNYEKALPYLVEDYKVSLRNQIYGSAFNASIHIGNIYLRQGRLAKADSVFDVSTQLLLTKKDMFGVQSLLEYYSLGFQLKKQQGEMEEAKQFFTDLALVQDKSDSLRKRKEFDQLNEKYFMEREMTKLQLLQKTNELQSTHLKLRTTILIIIAFALIVVLWYVYVLRHKNRKIDRLNELLEVKVSERTTRLMEINKELDNYLYRASHDIRRPIRTLLGLNNVVKFTEDPKELKSLFEMVYDTAMNMDEMLFKLQMAYELNNSHEIEEVRIYDLIDDSMKGMERLIELKQAVVTVEHNEKAEVVKANNALLKIAIDNILENALIYHNQETPEVRISTDIGKYYFYVHIEDNGYGIPEEYYGKIFNSYFKISNKTQGSGLGLFLAHKAISFLAGEIVLESVINEGTKFTIKIPISPK